MLFFLVSVNLVGQWKYPNADNIKNDIVITYDVVYENELSEKQKTHPLYKKEIVVIFNKNQLIEKNISENQKYELFSFFDYEDENYYKCRKFGKNKEAVKTKFRTSPRKIRSIENKVEDILGFPCQVYPIRIKGKTKNIYATKDIGLRYVKNYNIEGFLLKYSSYSKYFGHYTVSAKKISYKKLPKNTYDIKDYTVRTLNDQKKYFTSIKVRIAKIEKEIQEIGGKSTKYSSSLMELEKFGCEVNAEEIKKIEQMIKFQSDYYESLFKVKIKTIKIKLIKKFRKFKKIQKHITSSDSDTGFYAGKTKTIYVHKMDRFLEVIFHEINHAIVRQVVKRVPSWINEGMAEFFEYFTVKSDGVSIRMQLGRLTKTKQWLKEDKIVLKTFLNYSNSEWKNKNLNPAGYSYSVSYSFICYLYLNYPGAIGAILKYLDKGLNSVKAIEFATGKKIEFIEKDFNARL